LGIRTGRPRGAPIDNTNRLKHGRYSAHRIRRRKEVNVLLRKGRNLIRRIEMMAWSRKALRLKAQKATSTSVVIPGERSARSVGREGREPNLLNRPSPRKLGSFPRRVLTHAPRRE
jgi:hypothetical protein